MRRNRSGLEKRIFNIVLATSFLGIAAALPLQWGVLWSAVSPASAQQEHSGSGGQGASGHGGGALGGPGGSSGSGKTGGVGGQFGAGQQSGGQGGGGRSGFGYWGGRHVPEAPGDNPTVPPGDDTGQTPSTPPSDEGTSDGQTPSTPSTGDTTSGSGTAATGSSGTGTGSGATSSAGSSDQSASDGSTTGHGGANLAGVVGTVPCRGLGAGPDAARRRMEEENLKRLLIARSILETSRESKVPAAYSAGVINLARYQEELEHSPPNLTLAGMYLGRVANVPVTSGMVETASSALCVPLRPDMASAIAGVAEAQRQALARVKRPSSAGKP